MIALLATVLLFALVFTILRWIASVPVVRTLSASVDQWADSVQGQEIEGPLTPSDA